MDARMRRIGLAPAQPALGPETATGRRGDQPSKLV